MDDMVKAALGIFAGGWLTLLSFFVRRQVDRIDALEKEKSNEDSTEKRFDRISGQLDEHIKENRQAHHQMVEKLETTNITLAKIAGKIGNGR